MKVHESARKHDIDPNDAIHAAEHAAFVSDLDDDSPARQLRLGFDAAGRLLEVGADPASRRSTTFEQAAEEQGFVAERFAVQIGVLGGWTVLVEPNGYICTQDAVLASLSTAGRAVMVFWNVNLDSRFGYARQGVLVRVLDPVLGSDEVGDPLPEEAGSADDQPIHAALALAEALTDVQVTGA